MGTARIRLISTNLEKLDAICKEIEEIAKSTTSTIRGPIPLPTKKLKITTRKTACGQGKETWDRWEMRIHKRLIDLESTDRAMRRVMRIQVPEDVQIEIEVPT